jgi:hypothetical protein
MSVTVESILPFLKILAICATGFFGVLGVVSDTRDDQKKLTRGGKWKIALLIGSFIIAVTTQELEGYLAGQQANASRRQLAEQVKRQSDTLDGVRQTLATQEETLKGVHQTEKALGTTIEQQQQTLTGVRAAQSGISQAVRKQDFTLVELGRAQRVLSSTVRKQDQTLVGVQEEQKQQARVMQGHTTELNALRRLYLAQHRLFGVEVSWQLPPGTLRQAEKIYADLPQSTDRVYFPIAFSRDRETGKVTATRNPDGEYQLSLQVARPQGILGRSYRKDSPEARAFTRLRTLLFSTHFLLTLTPEANLLEVGPERGPQEITISRGAVAITASNTEIPLSLLDGGQVTFRRDANEADNAPAEIHIRSLDSTVQLDAQFPTHWKERPTGRAYYPEPGERVEISELFAGPFSLPVRFSPSILVDRAR